MMDVIHEEMSKKKQQYEIDMKHLQHQIEAIQDRHQMEVEDLHSKHAKELLSKSSYEQEVMALKILLQQEQDNWKQIEEEVTEHVLELKEELEETKNQVQEEQKTNRLLVKEIQTLQTRVDTALKTSRNFEQRLQKVTSQKQMDKAKMEAHLDRLERQLAQKCEENRFLTLALMNKKQSSNDTPLNDDINSNSHSSHCGHSSHSSQSSTRRHLDKLQQIAVTSRQPPSLPSRKYEDPQASERPLRAEDLYSHAPTSPCSSNSSTPPCTPPTVTSMLGNGGVRNSNRKTTPSPTLSSARLEKELESLRRKLDTCFVTMP
jgi:hypothetical protein